jgi:hypothetical protein
MSDFEQYAVQRIPQLRGRAAALMAEADALERALTAFRSDKGPNDPLRATITTNTVTATGGVVVTGKIYAPSRLQPGSQSSHILALLDEAGDAGCALSDIYKTLADKGVTTNKASARSVVWSLKHAGKVSAYGDRYFAAAHAPHRETAA